MSKIVNLAMDCFKEVTNKRSYLSVDIVGYPHHIPAPVVQLVAHHTDQLAHLLGELPQGVEQTDNNLSSWNI